jgi:hypothetical protein
MSFSIRFLHYTKILNITFLSYFSQSTEYIEHSLHFLSISETRRTSLLQKINLSKSKKDAVCPSPSKGLSQMDFLPGLGSRQRQNLQNMTPEGEDSIALSRENILNIKKRIFIRSNRLTDRQ